VLRESHIEGGSVKICRHTFKLEFHKKFESSELLEYTHANKPVGTPAFRRAFEKKTALSPHSRG